MSTESFLGTGWSFPPAFDKKTGGVEMLRDEEDIQSSLHVLLTTRLGERVMQPTYGCNLDELVFESLTSTFKSYIRDLVKTAILFHEPRVKLNKIELDDSREVEGVILIVVDYTVRTTNTRFNYVFPYYKNEGTDI
ncbi:GPW/gp25 family protein [Botryobacter ruber]|uniref:GPW/gp25 family protein n=1 Tax=Botryobacter ruber TaxID=2171629 RepID=UPI000E0AA9AE|nr:GPW/gp25 family protein [Botryobacter ruber]